MYLKCSLVPRIPVPRPAFRRLQYGTASNKKLGVGLGARLPKMPTSATCRTLLVAQTKCIFGTRLMLPGGSEVAPIAGSLQAWLSGKTLLPSSAW